MRQQYYAFYPFSVSDEHAKQDPVLYDILKKKSENRPRVLRMIDQIISNKNAVFTASNDQKQICFIGHSQLDQWSIDEIGGYHVRNCGVSGISSYEYDEKILQTELLRCEDDAFLVMHGTNDIVWDDTIAEIIDSIQASIRYIRLRNESAPILFLACMHVNGRIDRSNTRIDVLNAALQKRLADSVVWIDTSFMDDENGNLRQQYTTDGLHLTNTGYQILQAEIDVNIRKLDL